jgi:hypothetical protein
VRNGTRNQRTAGEHGDPSILNFSGLRVVLVEVFEKEGDRNVDNTVSFCPVGIYMSCVQSKTSGELLPAESDDTGRKKEAA